MKYEITTFSFQGFNFRALESDGQPMFVGSDILVALFGTSNGKGSAYAKLEIGRASCRERVL